MEIWNLKDFFFFLMCGGTSDLKYGSLKPTKPKQKKTLQKITKQKKIHIFSPEKL
jgi:hypothetical protein